MDMMQEIDAQMLEIKPWVQAWINWMMLVFVSSLLFVWKNKEARWALLSFVLTLPLANLVFYFWGTVHLFGIAHLICWTPLLIYLWKIWKEDPEKKLLRWSPFKVWMFLLMLTISISLPFDVYDIAMVILGKK